MITMRGVTYTTECMSYDNTIIPSVGMWVLTFEMCGPLAPPSQHSTGRSY